MTPTGSINLIVFEGPIQILPPQSSILDGILPIRLLINVMISIYIEPNVDFVWLGEVVHSCRLLLLKVTLALS